MKLPKLKFQLAVKGETQSLPESSLPSRDDRKVLFRMTPLRLPGWSIQFRSGHSKEKVILHLLVKSILESLNRNEKVLFLLILPSANDVHYEVCKKALQLSNQPSYVRQIWFREVQKLVPSGYFPEEPFRYLRSFRPVLTISKVWTERTRLRPKSFIGKGHSDQGCLPVTPSWREMISGDGDVLNPTICKLKKFNREFLGLSVSGSEPVPGSVFQTDEAKLGRNGGKSASSPHPRSGSHRRNSLSDIRRRKTLKRQGKTLARKSRKSGGKKPSKIRVPGKNCRASKGTSPSRKRKKKIHS